jgi:hypothetical protein
LSDELTPEQWQALDDAVARRTEDTTETREEAAAHIAAYLRRVADDAE